MLTAARKAKSTPTRIGPGSALTESLERTDTSRNEHEWKNTVEGPGGPTRRPGRQESREHVLRTAVENLRIVKASGEVREHAEKRKSASDERDAAGEDRSPCLAPAIRTFLD